MTDEPCPKPWQEFPPKQQEALLATRTRVLRIVPGADEDLSWGMPTLRIDGDILLSLHGFSGHNSVFPGAGAIQALGSLLDGYTVTKGTIHFDRDRALSVAFARSLVAACLKSLNDSYPKRSGAYKQYFSNGSVKVQGKFKDGARHGEWRWWRADGKLTRTERYKLGKLVQ
ncbi:hypothetical protein OAV85_04125 [Candidatus Nanopelagicales bacterium]|nr:hypothetical protein [Candidatus Nanopelagicales bacterium]